MEADQIHLKNRVDPMKRTSVLLAVLACLSLDAAAIAQQPLPPPPPPQPEQPQQTAAKKEAIVTITWTMGDQVWNFKEIQSAYEPVKGYMESRGNQGTLAVWTLRLVKDMEEGAAKLHEEARGTPFKVVLLDEKRTVINPDLPAQMTPVSGRMDDTIELYIALPDTEKLKEVKMIRVQRRMNVGFSP
jgi:hypothetical protein